MDIWSTPDLMIIQLKRFITGQWNTRKLDTRVTYPDVIDMSEYIVGPQKSQPQLYRLYGVSEHIGALGGGHYIAHTIVVGDDGSQQWFEFNDTSVSQSRAEYAHSDLAYVLFYQRDGASIVRPPEFAEVMEDPLPLHSPTRFDPSSDSSDDDPPGRLITYRGDDGMSGPGSTLNPYA
jgi:ubiquitin carboxyl-terminal hydrolase 4/11/15